LLTPKYKEMLKEILEEKAIPLLAQWCQTFVVIGSPSDTPRYSQILLDSDEDKYKLQSTISSGNTIDLDLTEDEFNILRKAHNRNILWNTWKQMRTEFLEEYFPTIKSY
jgi:hypothetical protein